ncbi:MAG: hypothetical protein AAF993_21040, partial [Pseudomonadota bacterium]
CIQTLEQENAELQRQLQAEGQVPESDAIDAADASTDNPAKTGKETSDDAATQPAASKRSESETTEPESTEGPSDEAAADALQADSAA